MFHEVTAFKFQMYLAEELQEDQLKGVQAGEDSFNRVVFFCQS